MKAHFQAYAVEHDTGWHTIQILGHPAYTAYGPYPGALEKELTEELKRDLKRGLLAGRWHEDEPARTERLEVVVKAIQHDRLVSVPLRLLVLVRPDEKRKDKFHLFVPKLDLSCLVVGEEHAREWLEESVRAELHFRSVDSILQYQYERSERVFPLTVSYTDGIKRRVFLEQSRSTQHPLESYGMNLVEEAKKGQLNRPVGLDAVIDQVERVLCSRQSPAALLVGPSGSGKSAVIHGLAHRIAKNKTQDRLHNVDLWRIPAHRWTSGSVFLGEWQEQARTIVELMERAGAVLDLGALVEVAADRGQESSLSLAQFLVPVIESGHIPVLAEVSSEELNDLEQRVPQLIQLFQRIPMPAPETHRVREILTHECGRLEKLHGLEMGSDLLSAVFDLVTRFESARSLPGSAVALLGEVVQNCTSGEVKDRDRTITGADATRAYCKTTGYPEQLIDASVRLDPSEVRSWFSSRILGQTEACDRMCDLVFMFKAGLTAPDKPLGSFLFAGPTGVGKTESALALTEYIFGQRDRIVRLDMSEYGTSGSALRLVDGLDGEGDLTRPVRAQPFSVILLDEIEKADGGVFDLLLQVLGEGRLTDGFGRLVSFRQAIIILTSNLGAAEPAPVGFESPGKKSASAQRVRTAVERAFRPELVNRIDHIVVFESLHAEVLRTLALSLLQAGLSREGISRRGLELTWSPDVVDAVVARGFEPKYGARPMKRAVEDLVVAPLARYLSLRDKVSPKIRLEWSSGLSIVEEPGA